MNGRRSARRDGSEHDAEARYRHKFVEVSRRRQARVADRWLADGWELALQTQAGRRTQLIFRKAKPNRRWHIWTARAGAHLCLAALLLVLLAPVPVVKDPLAETRTDAVLAAQDLENGDLFALDKRLAEHRGDTDFAYFFTSRTTPRMLGDALAAVVGDGDDEPLADDVDPHAYDLALTDLAGTIALATYGVGDRSLPTSWTDDFISATTTLEVLADSDKESAEQRADQDIANKQNLLLLLSRGYWSTEFLEAVTDAYWQFDHDEGDDAWPGPTGDGKYAPAPNGAYLTDGFVALSAALTANAAASKWAFTDFQPGTSQIDGSDYKVGKFVHYLLFEHQFPEVDGESVGMTAVLTALSSAIEATHGAALPNPEDATGALKDSLVLRRLAADLKADEDNGCSWNPLDYLNCVMAVAESVWHWVQKWGHLVLDILSLATFAPPPFTAIGVSAAITNATWYAIDGDFVMAGVSLAAAVPGLAFAKIAKGVKAGKVGEKAAAEADEVSSASRQFIGAARIARDRELAEMGASQIKTSPRAAYSLEREAEADLVTRIPGASRQKQIDPRCVTTCAGKRNVDIYDPKRGACIEVKRGIGTTNFKAHDQYEVAKDVLLRRNKDCKSIEWHFVPDESGNVGPHDALRRLLQENDIDYVMYVP